MYLLSEPAGVIVEVVLVWLYFCSFWEKRCLPRTLHIATYCIYGAVLMVLSIFPDASYGRLAFCAIALSGIAYFLFQAKPMQAIFASISFCGIYVLTEVIVLGLFFLFSIDPSSLMTYGIFRTISLVLSHMLLWLLVLIVLAMTKNRRSAITPPFLTLLFPGYAGGILLGLLFYEQILSGTDNRSVLFLIAAATVLYLNILIVLYAEQAKKASDQKIEMKLAESRYAMQEQYYEQLRIEQEETRSMFHDINKYMQAMRTLVAVCNGQQASTMLQETQKMFDNLEKVVDVGNGVVSVILNEYKSLADASAIQFQFDVRIPEHLAITAADLYVLLGNTLDNAIEACSKLPDNKRFVRLKLLAYHGMLLYQVENSFNRECVTFPKGKNHGYGLRNVRKCIDKYNGVMETRQADEIYVLSVRLNNYLPK